MVQFDILKDESLIPKNTTQCYSFLGIDLYYGVETIKICPYFIHVEDTEGLCSFSLSKVEYKEKVCKVSLGD